LQQNTTLKTYCSGSNEEALLQRDAYNRMWLYFYDYYSDHDRMDILYVLVANEADADRLVSVARLDRLRIPFVARDNNGWCGATEWGKETCCLVSTDLATFI
jgi:hypothetical protein